MKTKWLLLILLATAAAGCYYDNEEELYNCVADPASTKYSTSVSNILTANGCVGCHVPPAASGNVSLNTFGGVKTVVDNGKLYGAISHAPGFVQMPQGGTKISACDIRKVKAWIDAGAPNN